MADTVALAILSVVAERLRGISQDQGFATDLGERVYTGRRMFAADEDELPAVAVHFTSEEIGDPEHDDRVTVRGQLVVEAHAWLGEEEPHAILQELVGDIKRALFKTEDRYLLHQGKHLVASFWPQSVEYAEPDDVGDTASVSVIVRATWPELLGDPYTVL